MASTNEPNAIKRKNGPGRPFQKGNPGGPGNPMAGAMAKFRAEVFDEIAASPNGLRGIVARVVEAANSGDMQAAKLLLQYACGQPQASVEIDAKVNNVGPAVVIMPDWAGGDDKDFA